MVSDVYLIGFLISLTWLTALSYFLFRVTGHYRKLTKTTGEGDLKKILENLIDRVGLTQKRIEDLSARCDNLDKEAKLSIKGTGLLRFNPFKEVGGNQSFVMTLLNEKRNGLVLTSLYTRSGTRWYVKEVKEGKSLDHDLSAEETEAIKKTNL